MFPQKASYYGALKSCFFEVFQEKYIFLNCSPGIWHNLTLCPCKVCSKESKLQLTKEWKSVLSAMEILFDLHSYWSTHILFHLFSSSTLSPTSPYFPLFYLLIIPDRKNWEENVQRGSKAQKLKRSQIKTACPCRVSPKLPFPLKSMKERDSTHRL